MKYFKEIILIVINLFNLYYLCYEELSITLNIFMYTFLIASVVCIVKKEYEKYILLFLSINFYVSYIILFEQNNLLLDTLLIEVMKWTLIILSILSFFNIKKDKYIWGLFIGLIYFDAGLWKITSPFWINGMVFELEYYLNNLTTNQYLINIVINYKIISAWFIILYQILFIPALFFIKNKKLKIVFLSLGILQHIGIIILYNLTLFGLFMIILYIPLFKEESYNKRHLLFLSPLLLIIIFSHFIDYDYNKDRPLLGKDKSLIEDINYSKNMGPLYKVNNFINKYIYKTVNVYIPLKHLSNKQIESILKSNKYFISKKYLEIRGREGIIYSNVPKKGIKTFELNPLKNRYENIMFLKHSNFQDIKRYLPKLYGVTEFAVFVRIKDNNVIAEIKQINSKIDDKYKVFIENSVYNNYMIYGLRLK